MQHFVIAGPTASGKTNRAIQIAKQTGGVLVNADSRQIYKHLDVGTNKGKVSYIESITVAGRSYPVFVIDGIKIYLLSFLEPDQEFSVADFQLLFFDLASTLTQDVPLIVVGGTGLYLSSIINPYEYSFEDVNTELRSRLQELDLAGLQGRLRKQNPKLFSILNNSDANNPRRLVNLIMKSETQAKPKDPKQDFPSLDFKVEYVDLDIDQLTLRINQRVVEMFDGGIIEETKEVLEMGYSKTCPGLSGIGYSQVIKLLNGEISREEAIELTQIATRQYAKRQITWFGKYLHIATNSVYDSLDDKPSISQN